MPLPPQLTAVLTQPRATVAAVLPSFLASYVQDADGLRDRVRAGLDRFFADLSDADWADFAARVQLVGAEWGRNDALAVGSAMTQAFFDPLVGPSSALDGLPHLLGAVDAARSGRRVLVVGNHLSYVDPTVVWILLHRAGHGDIAARLTAVAGPKVYTEPLRLLGASAIHTVKVAQSTTVSSGEAVMSPRDVARAARAALDDAAALMDEGRVVVIYPEGRRTRTGRLGPFLRATARWLTLDGAVVVPQALVGTDRLDAVEAGRLRSGAVQVRFGAPIDVDALREGGADRDGVLAAAHAAVEALLPDALRAPLDAPRVV